MSAWRWAQRHSANSLVDAAVTPALGQDPLNLGKRARGELGKCASMLAAGCSQARALMSRGCGHQNVGARDRRPRRGWTRLDAPHAPLAAAPPARVAAKTLPGMMPGHARSCSSATPSSSTSSSLRCLSGKSVHQLLVRNTVRSLEKVASAWPSAVAHSLPAARVAQKKPTCRRPRTVHCGVS